MIISILIIAFAALAFVLLKMGTNGKIYGIFWQKGKRGFAIAALSPQGKVTAEDRSYTLELVDKIGGIALDSMGLFLVKKGFIKLGCKFNLKAGPISDEFREKNDKEYPNDLAEFRAAIKSATDNLPDAEE